MSILAKLPNSPVTGNKSVTFVEAFSTKHVVNLYRSQENLDVGKYFSDNEFYLLECRDTGYKFYYPFEIIGDKAFYENLQTEADKISDGYDRDWADDHKFAVKQIEENAKLLEIGCGSGKFLDRISQITKNVVGIELNSVAANQARKKGFDVQTKLVEDYCKEKSSTFDMVCAFQVLEHVADVNLFIDSSLKLLKPNGKLVFSVPNNEPYYQRFSKFEVRNLPPHHMGLWNLNAFKKLCEFYNMDLDTFEYTGESGVLVDAYLRSKRIAKIKSIPSNHSMFDKIKFYGVSPLALVMSAFEYACGKRNRAYISVVFRKR